MADNDALLAAYIDNELSPEEAATLRERLATDAELRARYETLKSVGPSIAGALEALAAEAPTGRLAAALAAPANDGPPSAARWRDRAAGFAFAIILAGAAALILHSAPAPVEMAGWRDAVAEYVSLYTPDTFAGFNPDAAQEAAALGALEAKIGGGLTPARVAIEGLRFKGAILFAYENAPLGQIALVDADNVPILFCVIRNGAGEAPLTTQSRDNMTISSWARDGRGYMVVARLPEGKVAPIAKTLSQRF